MTEKTRLPQKEDAEKEKQTLSEISPEIDKTLNGLGPEQSTRIQAIRQESFSGPLPHPEMLKRYDEIKEGFAERIMSMTERQLDHRISCENKIIEGSLSESKRGQNYGLAVSVLFLAAAVLLGLYGHDWLAGILGGGTLIGLVTVFVTNKKRNKTDEDNTKDSE